MMLKVLLQWLPLVNFVAAQLALSLDTAPHAHHHKREVDIPVTNARLFYYTTLQIGTPPQNVSAIIDTGSSDFWLPVEGSMHASSSSIFSSSSSDEWTPYNDTLYYDPSKSSTFHSNDTKFSIAYRDESMAQGYWGTDVLDLGEIQVGNVSVGIGHTANTTMGMLGLGLAGLESTVSGIYDGYPRGTYSNMPMLLKEQGITDTLSYSLGLGQINETGGSLIFGGIDHGSYKGTLYKVPLVRTYDAIEPLTTSVMLHGINVHGKPLLYCSLPVLLDSGSSINYLPGPFVEAIGQALNSTWNADEQAFMMSCETNTTVGLTFSGINVTVGSSQNIPLMNQTGGRLYQDGKPMCMLPYLPSDSSFILGVSTIRSLYLSFDYEHSEVAIANFVNSDDTNIEKIDDYIPGAVQAPSYSYTQSTTGYSVATSLSSIPGIQNAIVLTSLARVDASETEALSTATSETSNGSDSSSNGAQRAGAIFRSTNSWLAIIALHLM